MLPQKKIMSLLWISIYLFLGFYFPSLALSTSTSQPLQSITTKLQLTVAEQAWLAEHPVIRVANEDDWPPYDFSRNGEAQGLSIDLMNELARRLGIEIEYINGYSWEELLEKGRQKQIDLFPCLVNTPERQKFLLFTDPYMPTDAVIVVHSDEDAIRDFEDMSGRTLALVKGYAEGEWIRDRFPDIRFVEAETPQEALQLVAIKQADAMFVTLGLYSYEKRRSLLADLKIAGKTAVAELSKQYPLSMAVRNDWPILQQLLQKALDSVSDSDLLAIQQVWLESFDSKPETESFLTAEERAWLAEHPVIRVANETNWPPYDFVSGGKPAGLSIDLMNLLAERIGVKIDYITGSDWGELLGKAKRKEVDLFPVISKTAEREEFLRFTEPYAETYEVLVVHESDTSVSDIEDLAGKTMALNPDFSSTKIIKEHFPEIKIIDASSLQDALQLVATGRADATYDTFGAVSYVIKNRMLPNLKIAGKTTLGGRVEVSQLRLAARADWPIMRGILQKALDSVADKEFLTIQAKWFDVVDEDEDEDEEQRIALSPEEKAWLREHPEIRVGADSDWAPIEFLADDGSYQGFSIDLLNRIAPKLGVHFEFVRGSWQELIARAKQGELDLFSSVAKTPAREDYLLFTDPYVKMPAGIFAKQGVAYIADLNSLASKKIAVVEGYAIHDYLAKEFPDLSLLLVKNPLQGIRTVLDGNAYAYVGNVITTGHLLSKKAYLQINMVGDTPFSFTQRLGVRKDWPQLREILQKALKSIPEANRNALYNQWVPLIYEKPADYSLLWKILAGAIALLTVIVYWNRRLRQAKNDAEEAQKSLEFVQYAVDHAGDMAYWLSADEGRLFYVNDATVNRLGYSREELVGMTVSEIDPVFPTEEWPPFVEKLKAAGSLSFETQNMTKRGDVFPVEITARCVKFGYEDRFIAFGRDISERKRVENELLAAKQAAERANKAKSTFLSNMSHELRTPLTAILGYSHLLQRKKDLPEGLRDKVDIINRSGAHLTKLINDVLEVSRIESGRVELATETFNLASLLSDLKEMFLLRAKEKGLQLSFENIEKLPEDLVGDAGKIRQILINLIGNAIKFTSSGGIVVRAEMNPMAGSLLEISVKDSGVGISAEEQSKLFQPFEQTMSGKEAGGTGLGLVISREYARLLGGDLVVSSEPEKGSTFTFSCQVSVPQVENNALEDPLSTISGLDLNGRQLKILVADDIEETRSFLAQLLLMPGAIILEACNGEEALAMIEAETPDLVIMDMRMPVMDGYEAIRRLKKEQNSSIPVLAISASAFDSDLTEILATGADAFIRKPVDTEEFYRVAGQLLGVDCLYHDKATANQSVDLVVADFYSIPSEILQELEQAALKLDMQAIEKIIGKISLRERSLGLQLQRLVKDFRYDRLQSLLHDALTDRNKA